MGHALPILITLAACCLTSAVPSQNSNRKIRVRPSATAAKAGTAVRWRENFEAAQAESRKTGKLVFWYVPTLSGSPMDRKPEIDRYMMAGPFSWPRLITLLNDAFIPVRSAARGRVARQHDLVRQKFIEPGYLVLDKAGKVLLRKDQVTTFHPEWFMTPLARVVGREVPARSKPSAAENEFFAGVRLFHTGASDQAIAVWKKLALEHPDDPLGWKAAAEAEGHGPFRYGFEVFGELPAAVLQGDAPGSRAPDGAYDLSTLRRRSLDYLCRMQLANGGWEDSKYDFGGTDSLPNVYMACTAIIAEALLEELHADRVDGEKVVGDKARMEKALHRAMVYLDNPKRLNPKDRDELIWAHVYRIYFFCRYIELRGGDTDKVLAVRDRLAAVVRRVFEMQPGSGCWYHEYPNPFVTGEVLCALHKAEQVGVSLVDAKIARGLAALRKCRARNGAFSYGFSRSRSRAKVPGAAGRMPLCELALLSFGKATQASLRSSLAAAFEHHDLMAEVRKYDDHANRYAYGGFFFWFDMLGRTRALGVLAAGAERTRLRRAQLDLIAKLPEIDGCFVDSHELGRTYGTGMALLCLAQLRR